MDFNLGAKLVNTAWSLAAGSLLAQVLVPSGEGWIEKLGVLGIVVAGSYYLMKYFMDTLAKKDELIRQMNESSTTRLDAAIRDGHDAKMRIAEAQIRNAESQLQIANAIQQLAKSVADLERARK